MQVNTYWNTDTAGIPAVADADGVAWNQISGPEGSVAVNGGGWATPYTGGSLPEYTTPAYELAVSKPDPNAANGWLLGFRIPYTGNNPPVAKIRCFVVCLEDLPA